jgi:hypothetical protein
MVGHLSSAFHLVQPCSKEDIGAVREAIPLKKFTMITLKN